MRKFRSWKTGDIETRDITRYPIEHIGKISIFIEEMKYMENILYVWNIAKNLVSIGQRIGQGM